MIIIDIININEYNDINRYSHINNIQPIHIILDNSIYITNWITGNIYMILFNVIYINILLI